MTTILIFIGVLALLIFVHELGHYLTAIRNGVTAKEFGFGFPPRLIGVVKNDNGAWEFVGRKQKTAYRNTIFSLNWIPLGGFVRIKGEDGEDTDPDSFSQQSIWVRFKILVAGVVMNVVAAFVLFVVALSLGMPESVPDGTPGSVIHVLSVAEDSPAQHAGISIGDMMVSICDDTECTDVKTTEDIIRFTREHAGQEVAVTVRRGAKERTVHATLRAADHEGGALGVGIGATRTAELSFLEVIGGAAQQTVSLLWMIIQGFGTLVSGALFGGAGAADIAGPVGIAQITGQKAAQGLAQLAHFAGVLSLNLAFINILPIPALDGGRIIFVVMEALRGRPIKKQTEAAIHGISFLALIALMIAVTVNDVLRIIN